VSFITMTSLWRHL